MSSTRDEAARLARAEARRSRVILHKTTIGGTDLDVPPSYGADAISLAARLSRYSWSLAGNETPSYARADVPIRWLRRAPE